MSGKSTKTLAERFWPKVARGADRMTALDEPSTINQWVMQGGPINLRKTKRVYREPSKETKAIEGFMIGALSGVIIMLGAIIAWEVFYR